MKLDALKPILDHEGPFTSVCLDVTRPDEAGDREVRNRWKGLRRTLEQLGAPAGTIDIVGDAALRPTHLAGPHGRFVVASGETVLFSAVLADPPVRDEARHDALPSLLPAARAADDDVRYVLVEVDRSGADLSWPHSDSHRPDAAPERVEGGHDELHKLSAGGMSHRRLHSRVEDSWERNAEAVAAELDRLVAEHRPELVLLTGDVRAVASISHELGRATAELVVELEGGSRAEGVREDAFDAHVAAALEAHRSRRRELVLDRLREAMGRGDGAVTTLDDVVDVLRKGQLAELVVLRDAAGSAARLSERTLWVGPEPLAIATRPGDLASLGIVKQDMREVRADVAVLRAVIAQDAGVTFALEGDADLIDGIGALLRWTDSATPHENAPSYTSDTTRRTSHR